MDILLLKFIREELLYCFIFDPIHGIYFTVDCFRGILLEFDGMIPCAFGGITLRFFFAKYFGEHLVFLGNFHLLCILLCFDGEFRRGGGSYWTCFCLCSRNNLVPYYL